MNWPRHNHKHVFFYLQHFYKLQKAEIGKRAKLHPEANLLLFENYSLSSSKLSYKNNRRYSKKCAKSKHFCLDMELWYSSMV